MRNVVRSSVSRDELLKVWKSVANSGGGIEEVVRQLVINGAPEELNEKSLTSRVSSYRNKMRAALVADGATEEEANKKVFVAVPRLGVSRQKTDWLEVVENLV